MDVKNCSRKSQIIELVYGEAHEPYLTELRSHLGSCPDCSNELSSLSFARSNLVEFRNVVFEPLETPAFVFRAANIAETSIGIWGWLKGLRYAFAVKLSFAGILIAILAGLFGLVYIERQDEAQVAANVAVPSPANSAPISEVPFPGQSRLLPVSNDTADLAEKTAQTPRMNRSVGAARTRKAASAVAPMKRLNEDQQIEDFADDSLRLADLLEQIGG